LNPQRWAQIEDLFHRAAECDPKQRASLLDEACNGDAELRQAVVALLASEENARDDMRAAVHSGLDAVTFPLAGETVSHYRILDGLGGGGMGLVYRAEDIKLGRQVALKFLPEESAKDPSALGRFDREARSASALEHPNICPIYEFGEYEGQPFLVMQLLEGQTLRELISTVERDKPPLELSRLLDLAIQIADGLDAAHRQGIIHRDIKPANIFVTAQGQAKILDFGLAKLTSPGMATGEDSEQNPRDDRGAEAGGAPRKTAATTTPDPFLSRTGAAMGTAGYMSPEQARGEKLDARSDIFSFGLVLYEMATGNRAFKGDTGTALHDAILNDSPTPMRELNLRLPVKLEQIVNRAIEKDREVRYQSASAIRADLARLKQDLEQKPFSSRRQLAVLAVFVGTIAIGAFWFAKRKPEVPAVLSDTKLTQLTFNSNENPVTSGSISPDGKYIAFTDAKGIHLKIVGTEETRTVPQPETLKNNHVNWEIGPNMWFPDSTGFLANTLPGSENPGAWSSQSPTIWKVSVQGGAPRKVRDNAVSWSVSPDGSSISFATNRGQLGEREIWLMTPNGDQARKLYEVNEKSAICCLYFLPNGQRVSYITTDSSGDTLVLRDLQGGTSVTIFPPSDMKAVTDFEWLPDGRLIYSVNEHQAYGTNCNYWAMRPDTRTGQPLEKPKRLTNWTGFCMGNSNVTSDGKRLVFKKSSSYSTTYIANLKPGGTGFQSVRHFTLSTSLDAPGSWTADSKAIIIGSNRDGHWGFYKQSLDKDEPMPLVTGLDGLRNAVVSPDGNWVVYLQDIRPGDASTPVKVLRIPITGGTSQLVFTAKPGGMIFCARAPSKLCVIGEPTEDRRRVIVTAFDPMEGRGPELARFDVGTKSEYTPLLWTAGLSPDGTLIASLPGRGGLISIFSLRGHSTQVIEVRGWDNLQSLGWAADGKSLFVHNEANQRLAILNVDLHGNAHVLQDKVWLSDLPASPDGRYLAFMSQTVDGNMWMMENF
jgi:serine/threonine protein kinase